MSFFLPGSERSELGRTSVLPRMERRPLQMLMMQASLGRTRYYRGLTARKSLENSLTSGSIELMIHNRMFC